LLKTNPKPQMKTLKERKTGNKILFYVSITLIAFGTFNTVNSFAENESQIKTDASELDSRNVYTFEEQIMLAIIEKGLAQVGPIVGGAVGLGIQFARKKGLQISAEAEEYFVKSASTFVASQSRWIYEQTRDRRGYWKNNDVEYLNDIKKKYEEAKAANKDKTVVENLKKEIDKMENKHPEGLSYTLGLEARNRAIANLKTELQSDEFTKAAREMLEQNLVSLVEKTVSQNNKEIAEKSRKIIHDLTPLAIDSLLLPMKSKEDAQEKTTEIVNTAVDSIRKHFDFEEVSFDPNFLELAVKAELNKRIGNIINTGQTEK
jgi:hypothetical protein